MLLVLPFVILVLIHHLFLVRLIRKKLPLYIFSTILLLIIFGIWCFLPYGRPPEPPPPPPGGAGPLRPEFFKLIIGILLIGVDLGVFFFIEGRRSEKKVKALLAENTRQQLESQKMQAALSPREEDHLLRFKADRRIVCVDVRKIIYVESMSEYIKIFVSDAEEPVVVLYSLKRLIEQLPADRFMRIHRSYIIALNHIAEASRTGVRLDNGLELTVGELYRPAFSEYLASCRKA